MTVQLRLTLTALLLFLATFAVAGWFVLDQHRSATEDALDATLYARLDDLIALQEQSANPTGLGISEAEDTLAMIIAPNGAVETTTDRFGDPTEILDRAGTDSGPTTLALGTFLETEGTHQMRIVTSVGPFGQTAIAGQSTQSIDQSVRDLRTTLLVVGPLLALFAAATTGLVVRRALVPVEDIRRQAAEITLTDLERRIPDTGRGDELDKLASTLNDMLARLDRSATAQRQLVADVAHELRSPLAAIATQLEVGLTHPDIADWPTTGAEALDEARRLQRLIDNLLLLTRLDNDVEPAGHDLVDLDEIIHATVDRLPPRAGITVDRSAVGAGLVRGSAEQLGRVVQNLLDNGVRYATSTVTIGLTESDDHVVLVITDDGPGIPEAERPRVFERFYRVEAARDRATGGTGLGLAIATELVTAHGGTISADHADPTDPVGTTMTVRLPAI